MPSMAEMPMTSLSTTLEFVKEKQGKLKKNRYWILISQRAFLTWQVILKAVKKMYRMPPLKPKKNINRACDAAKKLG